MCGIFGIYGHKEAANITYLGLHGLQHRGQESAGIVTSDGKSLHFHRQMGHVHDCFSKAVLDELGGDAAIGHVRYSTTGQSHIKNAQPFAIEYHGGSLAIAHNGNLVNTPSLRKDLEETGSIFQSTMDTEAIMHLIARSRHPALETRIKEALYFVRGAYSLLFLSPEKLVAVRDAFGFRPLILGRLGDAYIICSETSALDLIEAELIREVECGEMIVIDKNGLKSQIIETSPRKSPCIFEYVYFARPDSLLFGEYVHPTRERMGRQLAKEQPAEADVIIGVPDSGNVAALGYAKESGIPVEIGLVRSHYVGRTFIEPQQSIRNFGVKLKLNPVRSVIEGKRVVVIDDSIVRGTTSRKIVTMIRNAGAKEVHMRIASPPTIGPCFYGIDTPTREELIASSHSVAEICKYITADSLGYLSVEGLHKAVTNGKPREFCDACFTNNYPIPVEQNGEIFQMRLFDTASSASSK